MGDYGAFDYDDVFVFEKWHKNGDYDFDLAIITLKTENTGFGWFNFRYDLGIADWWLFEVNGYPADKGFTMQRQSALMDFEITPEMLMTQTADIVVGNSGGPVWYTRDENIYAVVSHELFLQLSRGAEPFYFANGFARITQSKYVAMCEYMRKYPQTERWCPDIAL